MSLRAVLWAIEDADCQPLARLTLIVFANFASDKNLAWPALSTIKRLTHMDERTIRKCVAELEAAGLLVDTGQRLGRTKNVRVFALPCGTPANLSGLPSRSAGGVAAEAVSGDAENRTPANLSGLESGAAVNPCNDAGDTPANLSGEPVNEPKPLETPDGVSVPKGTSKRKRGHSIPEDWSAPPLDALPETIQARVRRWPLGAYEDQAEAFVNHWLAESGVRAVKSDWDRAWHAWIRRAGTPAAPPVSVAQSKGAVGMPLGRLPVAERSREGGFEVALRNLLSPVFAGQAWFDECGLEIAEPGLRVHAPAYFLDDIPADRIRAVAAGGGVVIAWVSKVAAKAGRPIDAL